MMQPPVVILARPQLGENIGAAARAMKNFGLSDLRLVSPRDGWPNDKAAAMATGALDIVKRARVFSDLRAALCDLHRVYATTGRARGTAKPVLTPSAAGEKLREASARGETCGIIFGNERSGLDNDEVSLADSVIAIPTAEFSSLNLAQAVLLIGYESFRAGNPIRPVRLDHGTRARKATRAEMFEFFDHLESELLCAGFLYPPDMKPPMIRNLRAMFNRAELTDQEVRTLRGVIAALVKNKRRASGD
ncbi:MAG: RNA methyltransferase [Alphaproteobacteria bacterium]|nr:RNA methyltransferase [Alphaproteobacteria bacterium]